MKALRTKFFLSLDRKMLSFWWYFVLAGRSPVEEMYEQDGHCGQPLCYKGFCVALRFLNYCINETSLRAFEKIQTPESPVRPRMPTTVMMKGKTTEPSHISDASFFLFQCRRYDNILVQLSANMKKTMKTWQNCHIIHNAPPGFAIARRIWQKREQPYDWRYYVTGRAHRVALARACRRGGQLVAAQRSAAQRSASFISTNRSRGGRCRRRSPVGLWRRADPTLMRLTFANWNEA